MSLKGIQAYLWKLGSSTAAEDYVHAILSLGSPEKWSKFPGMTAIAGQKLPTGDVVTQKGWELATDFLEEIGVLRKVPRTGTIVQMGRLDAYNALSEAVEEKTSEMRLYLIRVRLNQLKPGESIRASSITQILDAPRKTINQWWTITETIRQSAQRAQAPPSPSPTG